MSQGMNYSEILLKSHRAHGGGDEHFSASVEILSVAVSNGQAFDDELNAFKGDSIAHGMERRTCKRFDAMREGIGACSRGQFWRQADGEFGIEDDQFGQQLGMKQDRLAMRCIQSDNRAAADLAAGAGRSGNGNKGRESR